MKRWLCCALAIGLLLNVAGCHSHSTQSFPDTVVRSAIELADKIPLSGELIDYHIKEDVLRIECISPELNTYSLSVILYSLTENKVLGSVDLGESDWFTGWTDTGFYAASLSDMSVKLYDNTCRLEETKAIPDSLGLPTFFTMNEAADTYFIGIGKTATLYLYDTAADTAKNVGQILYGYQNPLGYRDGYFYLEGEDDLLRIHEQDDYAQTVYCDSQHLYKFIDMGIGTRENNFYVVATNSSTEAIHIPMQEQGEYPVAAEGSRFATLAEADGGKGVDTLRIYDFADKALHTLRYKSVQRVTFYHEQVLISTYDGASRHLYLHPLNSADKTSFTTSATTADTTAPSSYPTVDTTLSGSHHIDVPIIPQMPDYPTGCESVSAVMALNYWGEYISVSDFIDEYLPKSAYFYSKDGVFYGPNPFEYFVGDPRTTNSYGCMAPVIHRALNNYFGYSERVLNVSGLSLSQLCARHVAQDRPVLVWVTVNMMETFTRAQWRLEDGTLYEWPANEHCMVLVGYDERYYYFNDPYTGARVKYEHALCEDRYAALGRQALVIVD